MVYNVNINGTDREQRAGDSNICPRYLLAGKRNE